MSFIMGLVIGVTMGAICAIVALVIWTRILDDYGAPNTDLSSRNWEPISE